ncbi:hypothetical protein [Pantoea dispersa]|uniref:hypothetical protein n=1 Tax=Pantoea dispersa TaxID=59814 RepID=UPI0021AD62AA|nr:hypothetical protein [Pantoea dispersa]
MGIERQQTTTDKKNVLNKEGVPEGLSGWLMLIAFHLIILATVYGISLLVIFFALSYIFDSNTHQRNYFLYCPVLLV